MTETPRKRVLAIGGAYIDINCHHYPHDGSLRSEVEHDGDEYETLAGGSGVNFCRLCNSLGLSTTFVGKVGNDPMGRMVADLLVDAGIEPMLVTDESVSTNVAMNFVNTKGETIMPGAGNANQALGSDEVLQRVEPLLPKVDFLYLGTCLKLQRLMPAYGTLERLAHQADCRVVVDHGRIPPSGVSDEVAQSVRELALAADFYLPSRDEFLQLWGVEIIEAGLRLIADNQSRAVTIVKDGENGAYVLIDGALEQVSAFPSKAIHMVGAGDSFNAGVIAGQAMDKGLLDSIRYGCAVAALKIAGSPVDQESVERLAQN